MLVTLLGAGGSYPPRGEVGPGLLIDNGQTRVLIDCGEGCLSQLLDSGYSPCSVDMVYITHYHIDHWSGLPSLGVARVALGCKSLNIIAHPRVTPVLYEELKIMMPKSLRLNVNGVEKLSLDNDFTLATIPLDHTVPCYGVKILREKEMLLAYALDTAYHDELPELIGNVRVLIAEATLPSDKQDVADREKHMTVRDFLTLASEVNPLLSIPVHLSPGSLEELRARLSSYSGNVLIGRRGLQFTV